MGTRFWQDPDDGFYYMYDDPIDNDRAEAEGWIELGTNGRPIPKHSPPLVSVLPYGFTWPVPQPPALQPSLFNDIPDAVKSNPEEDREQELLKKVIPPFRGEDRCYWGEENDALRKAPREPHFGVDNARTQQSFKIIKRWVSTNFRTWPVCRHSGEPCELKFWPRSHEGGDGEYVRATFECECSK
jgi:hypothetical protein